jgi:hypothetical protein
MIHAIPHDLSQAARRQTGSSPRHGRLRPLRPQPARGSSIRSAVPAGSATSAAVAEDAYAGWIRRFIAWSGMRHPVTLNETDAAAFLSSLAVDHHVSASTQN